MTTRRPPRRLGWACTAVALLAPWASASAADDPRPQMVFYPAESRSRVAEIPLPSTDPLRDTATTPRACPEPVRRRPPNAWGLYDMAGNVWEWCEDRYGTYPRSAVSRDPTGPGIGEARVLRGGAWNTSATQCRSAARYRAMPTTRADSFGLRLVVEP